LVGQPVGVRRECPACPGLQTERPARGSHWRPTADTNVRRSSLENVGKRNMARRPAQVGGCTGHRSLTET